MTDPLKVANEFFTDVMEERSNQGAIWGDNHDDNHNCLEWTGILAHEVGEIAREPNNTKNMYKALVKVAAVCLAIAEWIERNDP